MLTSIKGLLNVSKFVSNNDIEQPPKINVNAGADILAHYQKQWAELHEINEDNAKNAVKLAKEIDELRNKVTDDHSSAALITHLLTTPSLKDGIENCVAKITNLYETFESVEKSLIDLENLIEDVELEQKKTEHRYQFALYKEKKLANLESVRQKLAAEHADKIMKCELKQKRTLNERQQVFQEAFHQDLEAYKSSGEIPKNPSPSNKPSALLEEIQLDLDKKELNEFLEDT